MDRRHVVESVRALVEPALLQRDRALPLALIVSEVMANAAKHAFEGRVDPKIEVMLERLAPTRARLVVKDNGSGYDGAEREGGTGTRLVGAFASQLNAEPTYHMEDGTRFSMDFDVVGFGGGPT